MKVKIASITAICVVILLFSFRARENRYDQLSAITVDEIKAPPSSARKVAIAFGGGGIRGFVHLGVIKALEEEGIKTDIVVGASAGAIVGSLYAAGLSYKEMKEVADGLGKWQVVEDLVISSKGFFQGKSIADKVNRAVKERTIEQLPTPLGIAVTDLNRRESRLVVAGNVGQAVQTSCAIPGSFVSIQRGSDLWVDGGLLSVVPVDFAKKMGASIVVGVDIYCSNIPEKSKNSLLGNLISTQRMLICKNSEEEMARADIMITTDFEPKNETSFAEKEDAIEAGYQAAKRMIPQIRAYLASAKQTSGLDN